MSYRLEIAGLRTGYDSSDVLHGVDLGVAPGEIVALLGPNGAGKTTLLNAVSGLLPVRAGKVTLDGLELGGRAADRIATAGFVHVPQGRRLFGYSTGLENLEIGGFARSDTAALREDTERFMERWPVARRVADRPGHLMSGGEQQVIAVGRGLMARPRVLALDEPSMGLAPILVDELMSMLRNVGDFGAGDMGILLVEQNAGRALEIADRVYVLVAGRIAYQGAANELSPRQITDLYLGQVLQSAEGEAGA